jgi:hypothetical protein
MPVSVRPPRSWRRSPRAGVALQDHSALSIPERSRGAELAKRRPGVVDDVGRSRRRGRLTVTLARRTRARWRGPLSADGRARGAGPWCARGGHLRHGARRAALGRYRRNQHRRDRRLGPRQDSRARAVRLGRARDDQGRAVRRCRTIRLAWPTPHSGGTSPTSPPSSPSNAHQRQPAPIPSPPPTGSSRSNARTRNCAAQARTRRARRTGHRQHPATHPGQPPPTPAAPRRNQDHPHQRRSPGLTAAARMPPCSRRMPDQTAREAPLRHRRLRPPVLNGAVLRLRDPRRTPGLRARRRLRGPGWCQRLHRSEILRHVVSSGSPSHRWKD